MTELRNKVAIVTGAGRGLGRAMASALAEAGVKVVVASRTQSELDSFVTEVEEYGGEALAHACDITSEDSVTALVDATVEHFGTVDILVNNSGVVSTTSLIEQTTDDWDRVIDTNLRGVFLTTREVGRRMLQQGSGKVINISSNFSIMGVANHAAYAASKAAVAAFTRSMAIEWARNNIQVNALAPGYFATDLNKDLREDKSTLEKVVRAVPARRMGEAHEIKPWLLLLAGSASDFVTGETIVIDGGQSVR